MNLLPNLLLMLPTLVWVIVWLLIRPRERSLGLLLVGMAIGATLAVPVWVAESLVDYFANPTDRWSGDFIEQVIGAALCEELMKFVAIIGILKFLHSSNSTSELTVPIALAVGIGFMTIENVVAMRAAESSMSMAISRQMTIIAGHPSYQLVMGYCLARRTVEHGKLWMIAALVLPIVLHGWGDFSERLFQDEPNPGSAQDYLEFLAWIVSIAATFLASLLIVAGALRRSRC